MQLSLHQICSPQTERNFKFHLNFILFFFSLRIYSDDESIDENNPKNNVRNICFKFFKT